ncbi:hypothetical protein Q5P01_003021 [Channa striata]|uniref:Ig-like domain-containing protein n=1 Tax=Channa striata TaxID=64152 RepID=A0AA88NU81_CHASR|nr:hypothetical protein Q5P01_003021 [Channa striata]
MAGITSRSFVALFTCFWILVQTSKGQQKITVKPGDNVTLLCEDQSGGDIRVLEWTRRDPEEDVCSWKLRMNDCDIPHPSFKNRVELRDPQMKDGDASVILKNVTIKDTGTYECRVRNSNTQPPPQLITTVTLTVTESGGGAGHTGDGGDKDGGDKGGGGKDGGNKDGRVVLAVVLSVAVVAVLFVIYRKKGKRLNSNQRHADTKDVEEPLQHVNGEKLDTLRMEETRMEETRMEETRVDLSVS